MLWKIAFRNLLRHRRRTGLNLLMILAGFSSIVVFQGFTGHLLKGMEEMAIKGLFGHYQIAKGTHWTRDPDLSWREKMISPDQAALRKLKQSPEVLYVSGRISFFGLLNTRRASLSAMGLAFDPEAELHFMESLRLTEGRGFSGSPFEIIMGHELQRRLQLEVGESLILVAQTVDGAINALDFELRGSFTTGMADADSSTFYVPLKAAQDLLDTQAVDRLVVLLHTPRSSPSTEQSLAQLLVSSDLEKRAWIELNDFYRQVMGYFKVQNRLIGGILMLLMILAIMSTISMSVFERMREIGTARALGDRRRDTLLQFVCEGFTLGVAGVLIATPLSVGLALSISALKIPLVLPGASITYPIEISILPEAFLQASLVALGAALLASLAPAIRASRLPITEALK